MLKLYIELKNFPKEETFNLVDQMKRACLSVSSNIAEGFEINTYKDKVHFYNIASSSLSELKNQLIISAKLNFISKEKFNILYLLLIDTQKLTKGLIRKTKQLS